jgi:hypothetical protein
MSYISLDHQIVDIFTRDLHVVKFQCLHSFLGLPIHQGQRMGENGSLVKAMFTLL